MNTQRKRKTKAQKRRKLFIRASRIGMIFIISLITVSAAAPLGTTLICYRDMARDVAPYGQNKTSPVAQPPYEATPETPSETTPEAPSETDLTQWNLILVNAQNKLPDDFSIERTTLKNGHSIDSRAYPDLQAMMDDARGQGLSPIICSSFRTAEKQQSLFDNKVNKYLAQGYSKQEAQDEAAKWVAKPGTSEHQTGLAVDIVALSYQMLDEKQADTAEQKWLMENAYKYGFILRYPQEKSQITGVSYEPWHYRYVGKQAAEEMHRLGLCLEEYLGQ